MKKVLSLILSAVMLLTLIPLSMFAVSAEAFTSGDYVYTVSEDGTATIVSVNKDISGNVSIPVELDGHRVTAIGDDAFAKLIGIWYNFEDHSEEKVRVDFMEIISRAFYENFSKKAQNSAYYFNVNYSTIYPQIQGKTRDENDIKVVENAKPRRPERLRGIDN